MKIAIYLTAVPKNKSETKLAVLKRFGEGILKSSDQVEFVNGFSTVDCDVTVLTAYFQLLAFILIIKLIIQGGCLLVTNLTLN